MHRISEGQYVLSLDQERKLAGTLAFLAHNREGAEHIPAVCIGEDSATGSLNVIFAVNKAKYSDGNDVLLSIQQGFDEVFALLARVSTDRSPSLKDKVFYMVVSMCSSRILPRLRLGPSGCRKMKRSFKDTLQELTMALTHISRDKLKDRSLLEAVDLLLTRAKEVRKVVDLWSRHQVTARLIELVESIYRIQQIEQLQSIIDIIPNNHMDPTARESFINIVGKVSRYREAARFLYRTAKNVPLARNMRTVPVHLPEEEFMTPSIDTYTPNLLVKVTEASAKGRQQKLLKEICRVLGLSEQQAKDQYCRQVALLKALIHAGADINAAENGSEVDPGAQGQTPFHNAVLCGQTECAKILLETGADPNLLYGPGEHVMGSAVFSGQIGLVQLMLNRGADVNRANRLGMTPLMIAAITGREQITRILLHAGAKPNIRGPRDSVALHGAARAGLPSIVKMLLDEGADPSITDRSGFSPLDYATKKEATPAEWVSKPGHKSVVKQLQQAQRQS
ncbi:hypothetical protein CNMCM6457_005066 [Aspergillus fumigatiaffinis]|nr:hypothetical protein CNMCM6457_005066 [Aspergillus fumigatiaffinis]